MSATGLRNHTEQKCLEVGRRGLEATGKLPLTIYLGDAQICHQCSQQVDPNCLLTALNNQTANINEHELFSRIAGINSVPSLDAKQFLGGSQAARALLSHSVQWDLLGLTSAGSQSASRRPHGLV